MKPVRETSPQRGFVATLIILVVLMLGALGLLALRESIVAVWWVVMQS